MNMNFIFLSCGSLKIKLADTKQILRDRENDFLQFKEITKRKDGDYETKIDNLERHVEDYDQLLQLSKDQRNEIDALANIQQEKEAVIGTLEQVELDLVKEKQGNTSLRKINGEIEEKNETMVLELKEFADREKMYQQKLKTNADTNDELCKKILELEEMLSRTKKELDLGHSEIIRYVIFTQLIFLSSFLLFLGYLFIRFLIQFDTIFQIK